MPLHGAFILKLPLFLLVLAGSCAAQDVKPLSQLQGSARVLMVFAPDGDNPDFKRQLQLIERHSFELSLHNTVVAPVSASGISPDHFAFENLPVGTAGEMADARRRYRVQPGEFMVILVDEAGREQIRSAAPVDIHELTASLDSLPLH